MMGDFLGFKTIKNTDFPGECRGPDTSGAVWAFAPFGVARTDSLVGSIWAPAFAGEIG
jgi:hypothetical protein